MLDLYREIYVYLNDAKLKGSWILSLLPRQNFVSCGSILHMTAHLKRNT